MLKTIFTISTLVFFSELSSSQAEQAFDDIDYRAYCYEHNHGFGWTSYKRDSITRATQHFHSFVNHSDNIVIQRGSFMNGDVYDEEHISIE